MAEDGGGDFEEGITHNYEREGERKNEDYG